MRRSRHLLLTFAGLCAAAFPAVAMAQGAAKANRVALVIGNAEYAEISKLEKPVRDAESMARVLRDMGFRVTVATNTTSSQLDAAAAEFARDMRGADVALFFYSGHGFQTNFAQQQHPVNHVVPVDFRLPGPKTPLTTLPLDRILTAMRTNARVGMVFMDACRNDPGLASAAQAYAAGDKSVGLVRGLSPVAEELTRPAVAPRPNDRRPAGVLIAYATDPGNTATEGAAGALSPFTASLVKHFKSPGLSIAEIMGRVSSDVASETRGVQTPWSVASLTAGAYQPVPPVAAPAGSSGGAGQPSAKAPAAAAKPQLPPNLGVGVGSGL